jgi:hypothetical protein
MPSGVINPFLMRQLLEVSPHKAGKVAGEVMYKHAGNYAKNQSLGNLTTLSKKASQVDRIRDMFAARKMKGRDLGSAFDEHKKMTMDRAKFKNHTEPKAKRLPLHKRMKNSWSNLGKQEKLLIGMVGGSIATSTAVGVADVYAENKLHKGRKK